MTSDLGGGCQKLFELYIFKPLDLLSRELDLPLDFVEEDHQTGNDRMATKAEGKRRELTRKDRMSED